MPQTDSYPLTWDAIKIRVSNAVYPVKIEYYPDGQPLIRDNWRGEVRALLLRPRNLVDFQAGLWYADYLADQKGCYPHLILPMVPCSRQDRRHPNGDTLLSVSSVAADINRREFRSVIIFDAHSPVTPALINRCRNLTPWNLLEDHLPTKEYDAIVAPDAGAYHRAAEVATNLGLPLLVGHKVRNPATGSILSFSLDVGKKEKLLVIDDICDGGATFTSLHDSLPHGVQADLWVTHGYFSRGTKPLVVRYRRVYTTDSVYGQIGGVNRISSAANILSSL